jgi:hypothetical protein
MTYEFSTMRELAVRAFARYLPVLPAGFRLSPDNIVPSLKVRVIQHRPARTLYKNRSPVCRSLDGVRALKKEQECAGCLFRKTCTPQICLEILHQGVPWRLILAYTSAKNFLLFSSRMKTRGVTLEDSTIMISVRDRGRWGEVYFSSVTAEER